MNKKAIFSLANRNPDVLSCIANLSNDEVFTPPELANRMLDNLASAWAVGNGGEDIWTNSKVRFLDPCTKSGVFLRGIAERLVIGLTHEIPDIQMRVDHILTQQVFGMAITRLTGLLSRRSTYCSKFANGPHSISTRFTNEAGNIWFEPTQHSWNKGTCIFCSGSQATYGRQEELETHAYGFIHTGDVKSKIKLIFGEDMQFDVIIGNPPYQLGDGASSAQPIYQKFVTQAKALEPRYLTMVTPSRWFAGGKNLGDYRTEMLGDKRIRTIVDYPISSEVFPGVDVGGGISYFLWDASHNGDCEVTTIRGSEKRTVTRKLDSHDIFIRDSEALSILEKIMKGGGEPMSSLVSRQSPFGFSTNFIDFKNTSEPEDLVLHYNAGGRMSVRKTAYVSRSQISRGHEFIGKWKVMVSEAYRIAERFPNRIVGAPTVVGPNSVCTQTFLMIGGFDSAEEAESAASYYSTKFFRFLLWLRKIGQHASQSVYSWVPIQKWDRKWTDEELYKKYGLSSEEVNYISSLIKPIELGTIKDD